MELRELPTIAATCTLLDRPEDASAWCRGGLVDARWVGASVIQALEGVDATTGAPEVATPMLVDRAKALLGEKGVDLADTDNLFCLISPGFDHHLGFGCREFWEAPYVTIGSMERRLRRWRGLNWLVDPNVPGAETWREKCFVYHRKSVGVCVTNPEHSRLLGQGVVQINHDGSAFTSRTG